MKKFLIFLCCFISAILVFAFARQSSNPADKDLEAGFINPPSSVQTSVYWYWLSDNISKDGVVRDLYAMKEAGINRAFIGNIGMNDLPYGKVKIFSEDWWDIMHEALKTATKLNIEIGIFNSPGWSQSGGPWVKSSEAMRYLASSELRVTGPVMLNRRLEQPNAIFQDVKIIAYPAPKADGIFLNASNARISSSPTVDGLSNLTDGNNKTMISYPNRDSFALYFESNKPFMAQSLTLRTSENAITAQALLQARDAAGNYKTFSEFEINRSNPALNVGFEPFAPIIISFPAITSRAFRLLIRGDLANKGLAEVHLGEAPGVEQFAEKTLAKMYPTPLPYWKEYQWRQQPEPLNKQMVIDASKVIDISKHLSADGKLRWSVPVGDWIIVRTGMTPTGTVNSPASPEATGYEVDKMSKVHARKHFNSFIGEILKRIPEADRKCFKVVVQDSYETGGQNFTDDFLMDFRKRYNYDALPYLPVYQGKVVNSELSSDRFLWDMRRMVADKVAYDYVGGLREVSHENGLTTWLENYGHWGFPSEFLMYGGQSDEIGGEFWAEGDLGNIENRAASSCGHIYGKTKISAESNTAGGASFYRYPGSIKQRGDRFFAEGINNSLLHVYISQPYEDRNPGMNEWFGTEFNRKNTWFSQMDVYTNYLKRTNFMLQQGLNVADVAYFIGEDAPKMTGITEPALPVGYQFDYMNAEVIEKYMIVRNGLITLPHGTQYRIMVLPKLETMRPELLKKIKQLVQDGAVIMGPPPVRSPSLQNQPIADKQIKSMASELWGNADGNKKTFRKYGKGMIINGMDMKEALALIGCIPDCKLPEDLSVHYGHRTIGSTEIYFISNQSAGTKIVTPEFRIKGLQPELWEAATGSMRVLPAYTQFANSTSVPLRLAANESVFIVFRKPAGEPASHELILNYPDAQTLNNLEGPWTVTFDSAQRGPAKPVIFNTLSDWSKSADEHVKYYSGTANYHISFPLSKSSVGKRISIDLGAFTAMAKVSVNGQYAGGLWTPPYKLDISRFVREGSNELDIKVVNTWVNRLIGDSRLPANQRKTWIPYNTFKPEDALQSSGLFGPVKIEALR